MTRERAKELLPIIQAYAEGKMVEIYSPHSGEWKALDQPNFDTYSSYRIKPEPKYIPYDETDNLLGEVVVKKRTTEKYLIIGQDKLVMYGSGYIISYGNLLADFTHLDGTPFGKLA